MEILDPRALRLASTCVLAAAVGAGHAAGYKLPESSSNATALSAAYVANASGPDASYYNPAAMAMDPDAGAALSGDLTLVHLPSIDFEGTQLGGLPGDDSSEVENVPVPTFHYMSPRVGNARFGLSVVTPGGLSKRWEGPGGWTAEEFTLRTIEINPTVGYRLNEMLAVGAGVRMVYSDGVVKSRFPAGPPGNGLFRDMTGDSIDFGYNLALQFEPNEQFAFAATYRSRIDLTVEGDARLGVESGTLYKGSASVEVPLPAALSLASAFKLTPDTVFEIVYERTYWSAYEELDFDYSVANPLEPFGLGGTFDDAVPKDWKDSDTIRFGLTHRLDDRWTLMAGFAIDESPAPKSTIGFDLPESDGKIYSVGARYRVDDRWELAGGILYTQREKLRIRAADANKGGLVGDFDGAGALLVTVGARYDFD